jgi:hypothetical protein
MALVALEIDGLSSKQNGVTDDSFEDRNVRQLEQIALCATSTPGLLLRKLSWRRSVCESYARVNARALVLASRPGSSHGQTSNGARHGLRCGGGAAATTQASVSASGDALGMLARRGPHPPLARPDLPFACDTSPEIADALADPDDEHRACQCGRSARAASVARLEGNEAAR